MQRRLKAAELPVVRRAIYGKQKGVCPLCGEAMLFTSSVLDHDHSTGVVRDVLCRNCNGIEGKIKNLVNRARRGKPAAEFLGRLVMYWLRHAVVQWGGLLHPLHKTDDEKRLRTNKRARLKRAARKKT